MIGEPDAGNPQVRFDEGMQETGSHVLRLRPTLQSPRLPIPSEFSLTNGRESPPVNPANQNQLLSITGSHLEN